MESDLFRAKQDVLDSEKPAEWLMLADRYIALFNESPKTFVLPKVHTKVLPLIENFAYDLDGFVNFIKDIRDECEGPKQATVHVVYRRVMMRLGQKIRRERLNKAIRVVEADAGMNFSGAIITKVSNWLEQYWSQRRTELLDSVRKGSGKQRLSTEERTELCDSFWAEVDSEIEQGNCPTPPKELLYENSSMESH